MARANPGVSILKWSEVSTESPLQLIHTSLPSVTGPRPQSTSSERKTHHRDLLQHVLLEQWDVASEERDGSGGSSSPEDQGRSEVVELPICVKCAYEPTRRS